MARSKYITEEQDRLNHVIARIDFEAKKLAKKKTSDPDFMEKYEELNHLRIKRDTIRSRIENFGEERGLTADFYAKISNQ